MPNHTSLNQLFGEPVAEPLNIHCTSMGKMQKGLHTLGRATKARDTTPDRLLSRSLEYTFTDWAMPGHDEPLCILGTKLGNRSNHLGNNITGPAHPDGVTKPKILSGNLPFVMQSGIGNKDSSNANGLKAGNRRHCSGASDLTFNGH